MMRKLSSPSFYQMLIRRAIIFIIYLSAFVLLDLLSHELEVLPGIVAWYPADGLSFAFLLTLGIAFLPALAVTSLISSLLVFQFTLPVSAHLLWAILLSTIFGFANWFLRRIRFKTQLHSMRDLFWLIITSSIIAMILTWVSVPSGVESGTIPEAERIWAAAQWWIGEMIGILVMTPVLLIHVMPYVKRFAEDEAFFKKFSISPPRPSLSVILQALSIVTTIYLAVEVNWPNDFHPFLLTAIPLIWIALQHGVSGASIGNILVNFGITWAVLEHHQFELVELGQLQLVMLVITMASLLVGIIVSENRRLISSQTAEMKRRATKLVYELIIIAILGMSTWLLEYMFDFYEAVTNWETRYQIKGIQETLVSLLIIGVASSVFSYRRWREVQIEIREREKAQAELQVLYRELEERVQERTADLSKANELLQIEIIQREQADKRIRRQVDYLTALQDIDRTIVSSLDMRARLNAVLSRAAPLLLVDAAAILLVDIEMNRGAYVAALGFQNDMSASLQVPLAESYAGKVVTKRSMVKISNFAEERDNLLLRTFLKNEMFVSYYGLPLTVKGKVSGVLEVYHRSLVRRDQEWLDFLNAVAGQTAIAIDNAQLFENLQDSNAELIRAYDATIEGWSAALDLRDKETEGHSQRVTELTLRLAEKLGVGKEDMVHIKRGALLHDIGKMGIPDHILLKPGKLTDEEWQVMQQHPAYAYKMLEPIRYLGPALEIPYCHHEKWDGTGYPRKLSGQTIPLSARIFCIVDVYDALTSDRPYRNGWSREKTVEHIRSQSGSHFDPQVVQAFLEMMGE